MKKRIVSLVLMLALLISVVAISAQAATVPTDVEWIEIGSKADFLGWFSGTGNAKHLKSGYTAGMTRYYKLTDNITIDEDSTVYNLSSGSYQVNTYFDLNGKTLTYASPKETATRLFGSYNTNTTHTFVNGTITNKSNIPDSNGGIFLINKGNLVLEDLVVNDLEGGTYTASGRVVTISASQTLTITNCTFNSNTSKMTGTGCIINSSATTTITGSTFNGSKKTSAITYSGSGVGGLVCLQGTTTNTITNTSFSGGIAARGGALYSVNGTLTLSGCNFDGGYALFGGNVYQRNGKLTIQNTNIRNGAASTQGGNLVISNAAKVYLTSGTISGGTAPNGGNIGAEQSGDSAPTMYVQGGTVSGGTATTNGGNIYLASDASRANAPALNISAGVITDGTATTNGGNICLVGLSGKTVTMTMTGGTVGGTPAEGKKYAGEANGGGNIYATYATVSISKGEVSNSHAFNLAGNIYPSTAATVTISGTAVISGGVADDRGGNFYLSSTNSVLNISGGTVKDGFSYQPGGNIFINNGKVTITGGVVSGGVSEASGGNIYASMGYSASAYGPHLTIKDDGNASTPIPQIINGVALQDGGNIYAYFGGNSDKGNGRLVLGNAVISGGNAKGNGDELYINGVTILEILPEFAQNIPCYISNAATGMLPEKLPGAALANGRGVSSGVFTGKLTVENHDNIFIYAKDGDTGLYFAGAATVDANGTKTWYKNNADALAAYAGAAYLQAGSEELALAGGDYVVDIAGNTLNITGTGNVTCFDSANDDYKTYGAATISGPTLTNTTFAQVNGTNYYTIEADGAYTFHRLDMKIITASLRPSIGGIYYTGKWSCDDVLANKIEGFGVAASLVAMPGNDFATKDKPDSKWTVFAPEDFESGVSKTGVMISGILKDASSNASQDRIAKNAEYAQDKIYAVAYVTIEDTEYTGIGLSYSMYDILKVVSDNIEMYSDKAATLQDFMAHWSANGLTGEPYDSLNFVVSEDIVNLNALYAGLQPYYGELHDHAATGGTSDGKQSLAVWKSELARLNMDFATIVDHKQSAHMYLEDWDNAIFIGGSEAACTITDRTGVKLHYNMIFSDPKGLEAVVSSFSEFGWQYYSEDYTGTNAEKLAGGWHFSYPAFTAARFTEVCEAVYANGGFVALVHPKSTGYISSEDPADAYFMDGIAMEVFYTYLSTRDGWKTKANHKLWVDMMQAGYKVYATAGNDEHDMPSDKATSVIYAPERGADAWVQQLRKGTFIAGGVGVRSAIGDTIMGGTTSFEGKRFTFSVSDFHNSLYDPTHTYRVDVWDQNGVAFTEEIACNKTSYFAFDADKDANYYYIEIYDVTDDSMIAIGNPIWNADK